MARIFQDGFETGDFSSWSSYTSHADLTVHADAAMVGSYGMKVVVDDTDQKIVNDSTPSANKRYRMRFYFDPNSITMTDGDDFAIAQAFDSSWNTSYIFKMRRQSGAYVIYAVDRTDDAWSGYVEYTISDAPHYIEIDWKASSGPGNNDGFLRLYVDGTLQSSANNIDTDTEQVDIFILGMVGERDAGTSGTLYFDEFDSNDDGTEIGTANTAPSVALNSPADSGSTSDTTPELLFTGTDSESDDITYEIEIIESTTDKDSLSFLGTSSQYAVTSSFGQLTGNAARTLECWFKTTSTANWNMISWGALSSNNFCSIGIYSGGIGYLGYANDLTTTASSYCDGNWHHIAVTFDTSTLYLYIDGTRISTKSTTLNTSSSNLYLASDVAPGGYYTGSLDEVRISDTARWTGVSFTVQTGPYSVDGNTIALYHINEGTGTTLNDETSNYDMTTQNTPTWTGENAFVAQVESAASDTDSGFANKDNGGDTDPFNSGDQIGYTVQSALSNGNYMWRVRASDPSGTNSWGSWTSYYTFTVSSASTASVSAITLSLTIPSVTATYYEVDEASVSSLPLTLSTPSVTATYIQVEEASVSPYALTLSFTTTIATYVQVGTASVAAIEKILSIPEVTATYDQVNSASVGPITLNLVTNGLTATYEAIINASVSPIPLSLSIPEVTSNYVQIETSSVSPLVLTLSTPEVTSSYVQVETSSVSSVLHTLVIPEVTATHEEVLVASISPLGMTLSIPEVTSNYAAVLEASVSPLWLTLSIPEVTGDYIGENTATVLPIVLSIATPEVTSTYVQVETSSVSPLGLVIGIPEVTSSYVQVEEASVSAELLTITIPEVTSDHEEVKEASVSPIGYTLSIPEITASATKFAVTVEPIRLTITVLEVTADYEAPFWSDILKSSDDIWTDQDKTTTTYSDIDKYDVRYTYGEHIVYDGTYLYAGRWVWGDNSKPSISFTDESKPSTTWSDILKVF